MPSLDTNLHVDMYKNSTQLYRGLPKKGLLRKIWHIIKVLRNKDIYGLEWGDPENVQPLTYTRDHFLTPYVTPDTTIVEIGPGGGRWTRYMFDAKHIYAVDYYQELLDELKANFGTKNKNITHIKNNGDDFPGIPEESIDFVFSFDAFVHMDIDIIDRYLHNIKPLLKQDAVVVIHYSDKTKPIAQENKSFSENDPEKMRALVLSHGYEIQEEDTGSMWHSSIIRFGLTNRYRDKLQE